MEAPMIARESFLARLAELETNYLRLRRQRLSGNSFELIRVIGKGAFGEAFTLSFIYIIYLFHFFLFWLMTISFCDFLLFY